MLFADGIPTQAIRPDRWVQELRHMESNAHEKMKKIVMVMMTMTMMGRKKMIMMMMRGR